MSRLSGVRAVETLAVSGLLRMTPSRSLADPIAIRCRTCPDSAIQITGRCNPDPRLDIQRGSTKGIEAKTGRRHVHAERVRYGSRRLRGVRSSRCRRVGLRAKLWLHPRLAASPQYADQT